VTNQTAAGSEPTESHELEGLSSFIYELGHLKRSVRTGWWLAGIDNPETVAEHSFRTAAIAYLLAALEGADTGKTVLHAVFHDIAEARTGDIPSVGKAYLKENEAPGSIARHQLEGSPKRIADDIVALVDTFENPQTIEAQLARDADKLECLAQALEYKAHGHPRADEWVQGSIDSVGTSTGRALAETMKRVEPDGWWKKFVSSYRGKAVLRDVTTLERT